MRTKVIITLDSGEEITKEYDVTLKDWPWQKVMIQSLIWSYIKHEQEKTLELKRAPRTCCPEPSCDNHDDTKTCEMCGKSCEGCVRKST